MRTAASMFDDGEKPSGWEVVPLADMAEVRLGRQRSPKNHDGPHMRRYIRAANVTWGGLQLNDVKEMNFSPDEFEIYRLRSGDLILAEGSGSPEEVGKPAIWKDEIEGCCFQNTLIRVRTTHLNRRYLLHLFGFEAQSGNFGSASRGVNIHHLGSRTLAQWPVAVPPLAEQRRIVNAIETHLSRIDAGVESLQRAQRNIERMRTSILKAAVEGRLVPQDPEDEPAEALLERMLEERRQEWEAEQLARLEAKGKVPNTDSWRVKYQPPETHSPVHYYKQQPSSWAIAPTEAVASVQLGRQRSPKHHDGPHMRSYLRAANVSWEGVDLADVKKMNFSPQDFAKYRLEIGDILLGEASGSAREVGKPIVWRGEIEECCFQNTLLRVQLSSAMNRRFGHLVFLEAARNGGFASVSRGVNIMHLGKAALSTWPIPIPPIGEQGRIVTEVERQLSVIDMIEEEVRRTGRRAGVLRRSVLSQAFSGRLVPQDPTDEPASNLLDLIHAEREGASA